MLSSTSPEPAEYARRIMALLCCALRPLIIKEVIDAEAVELGEYLEPERLCQRNAAAFRVNRGVGQTEIVSVCVTHLLEPGSPTWPDSQMSGWCL